MEAVIAMMESVHAILDMGQIVVVLNAMIASLALLVILAQVTLLAAMEMESV